MAEEVAILGEFIRLMLDLTSEQRKEVKLLIAEMKAVNGIQAA